MSDIVPPRARSRGLNWALVTVWGARAAWLAVAVFGGRAVGAAAASRSDAVQAVATVGAWAGWGAGALALAVPGLVALTAVRTIVPASAVVAAVTWAAGADGSSTLALAVPAVVAAVLVGAADTGRVYVQASAYGDEDRFPLRAPYGYLAATVVSWALWVGAVVAAPLLWAAAAWVPAVVVTLLAAAATWLFPRRWHLLSRRWLVAVPAGLVVHDPVVLADTLMMPRARIGGIGAVAGRASGALDLTGPTPGLALEIVLTETATAVLAPRPSTPKGTPIHLAALLVAPSRPGAVLREADRRRLPVH
ncbi:MAG: hypothetical protein ABW195_16625 [Ilumatobacteraceae bacterium]